MGMRKLFQFCYRKFPQGKLKNPLNHRKNLKKYMFEEKYIECFFS